MIKKHKNTEDCETTQEFPEWGLYTNFTDIPRMCRYKSGLILLIDVKKGGYILNHLRCICRYKSGLILLIDVKKGGYILNHLRCICRYKSGLILLIDVKKGGYILILESS